MVTTMKTDKLIDMFMSTRTLLIVFGVLTLGVLIYGNTVLAERNDTAHRYIKYLEDELGETYMLDVVIGNDEYNEYYNY